MQDHANHNDKAYTEKKNTIINGTECLSKINKNAIGIFSLLQSIM